MKDKDYVMVSARIRIEEKDVYDEYCEETDMSISQLIRVAVREYIENH